MFLSKKTKKPSAANNSSKKLSKKQEFSKIKKEYFDQPCAQKSENTSSKDNKTYSDDKFFPPSFAVTANNIQYFPFLFLQDHRKDYTTLAKESTYGQKQVTDLSAKFFSKKNIGIIQKLLINAVYKKTKGKITIGEQDTTEIQRMMMAKYEEFGRDLPYDIDKQIFELDSIVVSQLLGPVLTNIKQQLGYLKDITLPRAVMDRPISTNKSGRKTLPSVMTTFG